MSFISEADDNLKNARLELRCVVKLLGRLVIHQCTGYDSFNPEFKSFLTKSFVQLLEINEKLDGRR